MNRKYAEPSEEVIEQVKRCFELSRDAKFEFETEPDGYYIKLVQMYDYVEFSQGLSTLQGYLKIAQILGCTDGEERDRYYSSGCETCDYGSSYKLSMRFW